MENPLDLPPPDDPSERIIALALDLAYGAQHELWSPEITILKKLRGEVWASSSKRGLKIGDYLQKKWNGDHPGAELLASHGFLIQITGSRGKYMVSEKAYSLISESQETYIQHFPRDSRTVFVVHGRENYIRESLYEFLRSVGLRPLPFQEAKKATGKASPLIPEVLDKAFSLAQAVVVLMTPDDEARLRSLYHHRQRKEPAYETELTPQARPNVLFEAGMAMGRNPDRTILVEIGDLRPFTDIAGRLTIRLDNTLQKRQELIDALEVAKCPIDVSNSDWQTAGDFEIADEVDSPSTRLDDRAVLTPDYIVDAFRGIPDFSVDSVQQNRQALYVRLKYNHIDTCQQVLELANSEDILDVLRKLYIEELKRDGPLPLDPFAVVTWGAFLFINGLSEQTVSWVREQLRQSSEYKEKHGLE